MDLLRNTLRVNAMSCLAFGVLFAAIPAEVAAFLGRQSPAPAWALAALGVGLVINGAALWWVSGHRCPSRAAVLIFSGGDFAWVLATVALIGAGVWIDTAPGVAAAVAVAVLVGGLGTLQLAGLGRRPVC
jgi:hypothetical protein